MKRSTEYKITLGVCWLLVLAFATACGQTIKTKSEQNHHFDPVKVQVSGSVYVSIMTTIVADPKIKQLIDETCGDKLSCSQQTMTDLLQSLNDTLVKQNLPELPTEQPIK